MIEDTGQVIVIVVLVAIITAGLSKTVSEANIAEDCENHGIFIYGDKSYMCERREKAGNE